MLAPQGPRIICREILDSDKSGVIALLLKGYQHDTEHWIRSLGRLARHPTPAGFPKYGYLLESGGKIVGVILLIVSSTPSGNDHSMKCNIAAWCVDPEFGSYAPLLHSRALKRKDVTYMNVPGPNVQRIVEAMGFSRYCDGQFIAIPALSKMRDDDQVRVVEAHRIPDIKHDLFEQDLLLAHTQFRCISLWCLTADEVHPFVFHPVNVRGFIPCARLIYCRNIDDFVRFARPIGRYLLKRGRPFALVDANGPIPGLIGRYFENSRPKYFKGPTPPRLGDLSYTNLSMF
jgi:hypothetical protein